MSKEKAVSLHKRLAMGDREDKRYAKGGPIITPRMSAVPAATGARPVKPLPQKLSNAKLLRKAMPGDLPFSQMGGGQPMNPMTEAKMQNGVPGMKKGGRSKRG